MSNPPAAVPAALDVPLPTAFLMDSLDSDDIHDDDGDGEHSDDDDDLSSRIVSPALSIVDHRVECPSNDQQQQQQQQQQQDQHQLDQGHTLDQQDTHNSPTAIESVTISVDETRDTPPYHHHHRHHRHPHQHQHHDVEMGSLSRRLSTHSAYSVTSTSSEPTKAHRQHALSHGHGKHTPVPHPGNTAAHASSTTTSSNSNDTVIAPAHMVSPSEKPTRYHETAPLTSHITCSSFSDDDGDYDGDGGGSDINLIAHLHDGGDQHYNNDDDDDDEHYNNDDEDDDDDDDGDDDDDDDESCDNPRHHHPIDRPGCDKDGMPILTSIHYFGVLWNYVAVGFYYGTLGSLAYPIFSQLFNLKSYRVKGSMQFIMIWWSFKTFIACMSDVLPIRGYRRKYYILAGWAAALVLTILAIILGQPHKDGDPVPYVVTFSAMTLAYLVADVACDGMVVDLALNEPLERRGTIQSMIYIARSVAMAITSTCMAFLFSSEEYGGDFAFGIKLPHYLWILVVVNVIGLYFYFRLADLPNQPVLSYMGQLRAMFKRMELNAMWHAILFSFFVHLFAYIQNAASYDIQKQFCNVRPVVDGIFNNVLSSIIMALAIYFTKRYLLNTSWHTILAVTIVLMAVLNYIPAILVDFNVIRSQYFYVGAPLMEQVVKGVFFIVSSFVGVELATRSSAAITFGLMTTVSNLTHPLTTALSANLASLFHIYDTDGITLLDTTEARWELFKLDTCIFVLQLAALFSLWLIPRQKTELQAKLRKGETNTRAAAIIVLFLFLCLAYSITTNTLASIESTSCLRIAGGKGC